MEARTKGSKKLEKERGGKEGDGTVSQKNLTAGNWGQRKRKGATGQKRVPRVLTRGKRQSVQGKEGGL